MICSGPQFKPDNNAEEQVQVYDVLRDNIHANDLHWLKRCGWFDHMLGQSGKSNNNNNIVVHLIKSNLGLMLLH